MIFKNKNKGIKKPVEGSIDKLGDNIAHRMNDIISNKYDDDVDDIWDIFEEKMDNVTEDIREDMNNLYGDYESTFSHNMIIKERYRNE